jgi:hypothetical protein
MKMALDYWYELWENSGSKGGTSLDQHPEEEDRSYQWEEDCRVWIRDKESPSDSR